MCRRKLIHKVFEGQTVRDLVHERIEEIDLTRSRIVVEPVVPAGAGNAVRLAHVAVKVGDDVVEAVGISRARIGGPAARLARRGHCQRNSVPVILQRRVKSEKICTAPACASTPPLAPQVRPQTNPGRRSSHCCTVSCPKVRVHADRPQAVAGLIRHAGYRQQARPASGH